MADNPLGSPLAQVIDASVLAQAQQQPAQNPVVQNPVVQPPVVQPPVVQAPQQPAVDFAALTVELGTLDTPDDALPADGGALQAIRYPAQQAIAGQNGPEALRLMGELRTLHARVVQVVAAQRIGFPIHDRLEAAMAAVPEPVKAAYGKPHPIAATLDQALATLRNHRPNTDFGAINAALQQCEPVVAQFEEGVAATAAEFARLTRLWGQFGTVLATKDTKIADLAKRFFPVGKTRPVEWASLVTKAEGMVVPDSKAMQTLQKQDNDANGDNPGEVMLRRLVLADMVTIVTSGPVFYESSYDLEIDHFGGSWGLQPKAGTGKMQWLTAWEFHIHGEAVRNAGGVVTGFRILVGHVKPTAKERALGASVQLAGAILGTVEAGSGAHFARWAQTKEGEQTLSRKKRGK